MIQQRLDHHDSPHCGRRTSKKKVSGLFQGGQVHLNSTHRHSWVAGHLRWGSGMSRALDLHPSRAVPPANSCSSDRRRRPKRVLIRNGWGVWPISIREQNRDARFENASKDCLASQNISRPGNGSVRTTPQHHGLGRDGRSVEINQGNAFPLRCRLTWSIQLDIDRSASKGGLAAS